jgi:hypothetical protein
VCPSPALTSELPEPAFPSAPNFAFSPTLVGAKISGVVYDSDEAVLRDIKLPCVCLSTFPVLTINPVYGDATVFAPGQQLLFYTELFTYTAIAPTSIPANPNTFTGYRSIVVKHPVWPGGSGDDFGSLNNGSAAAYLSNDFAIVPPGLR